MDAFARLWASGGENFRLKWRVEPHFDLISLTPMWVPKAYRLATLKTEPCPSDVPGTADLSARPSEDFPCLGIAFHHVPSTSTFTTTTQQQKRSIFTMAPRLAASRHQLIGDMILSGALKQADIAKVAGCTKRLVQAIASNLRHFGTTRAPSNGAGRRRRITPPMLEALREYLRVKPGLCQD
ncbi:hypothetical protein V2W45_1499998 [Cenococcum geophilum]